MDIHLPAGGEGPIPPAFAALHYVAELEEMVVADTSFFRSDQNFQQRAAHGVVAALMASYVMARYVESAIALKQAIRTH